MKKILIVVVSVLIMQQETFAQVSAGYIRAGTLGQVLTEKNRAKDPMSEIYMDTSWRTANIELFNSDQKITNIPAKYEMKSNTVELLVDKEIKVLDPKMIRTMNIADVFQRQHTFIYSKALTLNGTPIATLLEVIYAGKKISVYKQHTWYVKPGDRNETLGIGTTDPMLMPEDHLFYATGRELVKLPKKKKIIELFGDKGGAMEKFIKTNHLSTTNEGDLKTIFEKYDNL